VKEQAFRVYRRGRGLPGAGVRVRFRIAGIWGEVPVTQAGEVAFEAGGPLRRFPASRRMGHYTGLYWAESMRAHVPFESLFERAALMLFDRDLDVEALSSQSMEILWPAGHQPEQHVPDLFVRRRDGGGEVIDVRPAPRIDGDARRVFAAMREVCDQAGLRYRVVSELPASLIRNLSFLAGFARPEMYAPLARLQLGDREDLAEVATLEQHASRAGGLALWYWLLWSGYAWVDLDRPLTLRSLVRLVQAPA